VRRFVFLPLPKCRYCYYLIYPQQGKTHPQPSDRRESCARTGQNNNETNSDSNNNVLIRDIVIEVGEVR